MLRHIAAKTIQHRERGALCDTRAGVNATLVLNERGIIKFLSRVHKAGFITTILTKQGHMIKSN